MLNGQDTMYKEEEEEEEEDEKKLRSCRKYSRLCIGW